MATDAIKKKPSKSLIAVMVVTVIFCVWKAFLMAAEAESQHQPPPCFNPAPGLSNQPMETPCTKPNGRIKH